MSDSPWLGDACSLVETFRAKERSPVEELEATFAAIDASDLNAFSFLDPDRAFDAARDADVNAPFGGVPVGVKELEPVAGWPATEASLVFRDRIAPTTSLMLDRLLELGGAVPVGLTTASEFGGLNIGMTKLNGITHNPWRHGRTTGGSSAGSSAAVAGGLVPLATGGDGGGSIRIPAGYTGLLGMKGTYGRIPRSPDAWFRPGTVVLGCLSRSVRDAARYYDVCSGYDPIDPTSLPKQTGWEANLGSHDLRGLRVAVIPGIGGVTLEPGVEARVRESAAALIAETGMVEVDLRVDLPNLAAHWMIGNMSTLRAELGDKWPGCVSELTAEMAIGLQVSESLYNLHTAAVAEELRVRAYGALARAFEQVDLIIAATNPGTAFAADAPISSPRRGVVGFAKANPVVRFGFRAGLTATRAISVALPKFPSALLDGFAHRFPDIVQMGGLTMISNLYGNPAVSIPAASIDGLPVGMQVLTHHHADALLFDVALAAERAMPWPLVAPTAARPAASISG